MSGTQFQRFEGSQGLVAFGNVNSQLSDEQLLELTEAIKAHYQIVGLILDESVRSINRDGDSQGVIQPTIIVTGEDLLNAVGWLQGYIEATIRAKIASYAGFEPLMITDIHGNLRADEALNGLVFGPGMRIETHQDLWALNANLVLKARRNQFGETVGETLIGKPGARSYREVVRDPEVRLPASEGCLSFFNGQNHPHTTFVEYDEVYPTPVIEEGFWEHPETRISINFAFTTREQQANPEPSRQHLDLGVAPGVHGKIPHPQRPQGRTLS